MTIYQKLQNSEGGDVKTIEGFSQGTLENGQPEQIPEETTKPTASKKSGKAK